MFGKIVYISDNIAHIEIPEGTPVAMNLMNMHVVFEDDVKKILGEVEDVSKEIRSKEVTDIVSSISSIVSVRKVMVDLQRKFALGHNIIMEGRDITTVVFPNADFKFYLDASIDERTRRRVKQNKEKGIFSNYEEIKQSIIDRDYIDMHKEVGTLKRSDDQIYIDSTNMEKEEVVDLTKLKNEGYNISINEDVVIDYGYYYGNVGYYEEKNNFIY